MLLKVRSMRKGFTGTGKGLLQGTGGFAAQGAVLQSRDTRAQRKMPQCERCNCNSLLTFLARLELPSRFIGAFQAKTVNFKKSVSG